jgi:hypothetical protein
MYTGTLIADLFDLVERAEKASQPSPPTNADVVIPFPDCNADLSQEEDLEAKQLP